jgi:hypothetical protein
MSERIESKTASGDPLGVVTKVLTAQAFLLDRLFFRAARDAAVNGLSHRLMNKALKAQARCRATFKILLALQTTARRSEKFSNLTEGTIQTLKTPVSPMPYEGAKRPAPPPRTDPTHKRLGARKRWTPERRARQAEAIRSWQPWRNSSGPKTPEGKTRSARNALKHGHKSRAYVEMLREDRRILHLAAANIAIAKLSLRMLSARMIVPPPLGGEAEAPARSKALRVGVCSQRSQFRRPVSHRIGIGRARPALIPFARKFSGNRGLSGLPPADNAAPRRRWRIARHDEEDVPLKQG